MDSLSTYRIDDLITPAIRPSQSIFTILLQYAPLTVAILCFLVLEVISFKLSAWIGGEKSGRRALALFYFTLNSFVIAAAFGILIQSILNSLTYSVYF